MVVHAHHAQARFPELAGSEVDDRSGRQDDRLPVGGERRFRHDPARRKGLQLDPVVGIEQSES